MYMGELVRYMLLQMAEMNLVFEGHTAAISKENCFPTKYVSEIEE